MYIANIDKSQKSNKSHKKHTDALISQIRTKLALRQIEHEHQLNTLQSIYQNQRINKMKKKEQSSKINNFQNKITFKSQLTEKQEDIQTRAKERRRTSKLEIQLQEIIKYSEMYPGRKSNQSSNSSTLTKPRNSLAKKQNSVHQFKKKEIVGSRFMKIGKKKNNARKIMKQNSSKNMSSHLNPDLFIDFVPSQLATPNQPEIQKESNDSVSNESSQLLVRKNNTPKNILKLLKKSKKLCEEKFNSTHYSFETIIEKEIAQKKRKNARNTTQSITKNLQEDNALFFKQMMKKPLSFVRKNLQVKLSQQPIIQIHNLIKGRPELASEHYSDHFNTKQIREYQKQFQIYKQLYYIITEQSKNEAISASQIKQANVKNAFYLNKQLGKAQSVEATRQMKSAMKRIKMLNIEN